MAFTSPDTRTSPDTGSSMLVAVGLLALILSAPGCAGDDENPEAAPIAQASESWHWMNWCGGSRNRECSDHSVCLPVAPRGCPGHRRIGFCVPRPRWCPPAAQPVCGCDGNTYSNLCEAARAGAAIEHRGACSGSGEPVCGGVAGMECAGSGVCVDDPTDKCDASRGVDCPGVCDCSVIEPCPLGQRWNDDPTVCGCVAQAPDPCAGITCPNGTECVPGPDGALACEPL